MQPAILAVATLALVACTTVTPQANSARKVIAAVEALRLIRSEDRSVDSP
jgi:hypothetical protein